MLLKTNVSIQVLQKLNFECLLVLPKMGTKKKRGFIQFYLGFPNTGKGMILVPQPLLETWEMQKRKQGLFN